MEADNGIRFTISQHQRDPDRVVLRVTYRRIPEHQALISRALDILVTPRAEDAAAPADQQEDRWASSTR